MTRTYSNSVSIRVESIVSPLSQILTERPPSPDVDYIVLNWVSDAARTIKSARSKDAIKRIREMDRLSPADSRVQRVRKLETLWSLSDAAIEEGMETWGELRIATELAGLRGQVNKS